MTLGRSNAGMKKPLTAPKLQVIPKWLRHKNVLFVLIAVAAFLLWPGPREGTRPLPRAEASRLVYAQDFSSDVLADPASGWSSMRAESTDVLSVKDGVLTVSFDTPELCGAVYVFERYEPRRIYEVRLRVKQVKTEGACIIRYRKKGSKKARQLAGVLLVPSESGEYQNISLEFVAPRKPGREVLVQLYQYERKKCVGGTLHADSIEIHRW